MKRKHSKRLIIGIVLMLLVSLPVLLSFFWMPYDPNAMDAAAVLKAPSIRHWFGTDNFGRDIFVRVVEGVRSTFLISIFTVVCGAVVGTAIGAFTGYYGGIIDEILMRFNDSLASFPSILLALVVVSILDKGTLNICVALGIVFIPSFARIMRAEFLAEKNRDYVSNAKLMGASDLRIIFVHIFPNTLPVLLSTALVGINNAVLAEAGLSFLGLGVQPPDPSLGRMLAEAQVYIWGAPWYVSSACICMVAAILGITLISENIGVLGLNFRQIRAAAEKRRAARFAVDGEKIEKGLILQVSDLKMGFIEETAADTDYISETLHGVDFDLYKGEILGIVGESGSGKSMTALSIMGILPDNAAITGGDIFYREKSLIGMPEKDYCAIRGRRIAMIFQEPMTSLNPVQTIGTQIDEVLDIHFASLTEEEKRAKELKALAETGLEEPDKLFNMYPHELSGGMRQRVMIAMALVAEPDVIIADEPTTALDAAIADVILDIFRKINRKYNTSIILISHDLEIIESICDRALIMQNGNIVETLSIRDAEFGDPITDYGNRLLDAAYADSSFVEELPADREILVHMKDMSVFYKNRTGGIFSRKYLKQVNYDISLDIMKGDCIGLVGSSGCGKTTLVKAVAGLQKYTEGTLELNCGRPSMVFQDPRSSLNPAFKVGRLLEEPLIINTKLSKEERLKKVYDILEAVELDRSYAYRRVDELSGGQRQRVSIALALILKRDLIILDEPVSALDVTIREQILELLMKLKKRRNLTFILISHDKRLVARACNRVYTIENGRLKTSC